MYRRGFTLLELLIVIAILAVLATVAVLVINPAEYLRQSRDAKRIADMVALNKALEFAEFNDLNMGGASTTVFVSLVNATADCAGLGLPALPTGYQYNCVTIAANLRKTNGTGWIPVNLGSITGGSPLAALPTDPVNNATTFYTYIPGGSFAVSATLESEKYMKQNGMADGGTNPAKIERGSDIELLSRADGLVGYWPFDEGSGTVAKDMSGTNNNGVWNGTYGVGKMGSAASFNGTSNFVGSLQSFGLTGGNAMSVSAWINPTNVSANFIALQNGPFLFSLIGGKLRGAVYSGGVWTYATGSISIPVNQWSFVSMTYDGAKIRVFVNGQFDTEAAVAGALASAGCPEIGRYNTGVCGTGVLSYFGGLLDEVKIYKRALSVAEVKALYDAAK